jgi:hypothetical protein
MDFEGWSRKRVFDGRGFDAQLPVGSCVLHGENFWECAIYAITFQDSHFGT